MKTKRKPKVKAPALPVLQVVFAELANSFESDTRTDGTIFYKIKADAPDWVTGGKGDGFKLMQNVHEALDDRLPDDWVYGAAEYIASKFTEYPVESISEMFDNLHEIVDGYVDVYNSELVKWLASNLNNAALCDEAVEEFGYDKDRGIFGMIAAGQYHTLELIGSMLLTAVREEVEAREDS